MAVVTTNLGVITAYGDAVAAGYTGTKADWQALMASYGEVVPQMATMASDLDAIESDVSDLKEDLNSITTATSDDVGKALKAKTVTDGKVTEWEFGEAGPSIELDSTLTDATKAAQAKAVGDAINALSAGTNKYVWEQGGIANTSPGANSSASNRARTADYIEIGTNAKLTIPSDTNCSLRWYTSAKAFVSADSDWRTSGTYDLNTLAPSTAVYVRIVIKFTNNRNVTASDLEYLHTNVTIAETYDLVTEKALNDAIAIVGADVSAVEDNVTALDTQMVTGIPSVTWEIGAINTYGSDSSSTTRARNVGYITQTPALIVVVPVGLEVVFRWYAEDGTLAYADSDWRESGTYTPYAIHATDKLRIALRYPNDATVTSDTITYITNNVSIKYYADFSAYSTAIYDIAGNNVRDNLSVVAAKVINFSDGTKPYTDWYLLASQSGVYYRSKDLKTKERLFTFAPPYSTIHSKWAVGIDGNNNVFFVLASSDLSNSATALDDSARRNPVYFLASENYSTMHTLDFGNGLKPCGWLENVGWCVLPNNDIIMCEYTRPHVKTCNVWHVDGTDTTDPTNWTATWSHDIITSDDPSVSGVKHCHYVAYDFYTDICYFGTGDSDDGSFVYYSTNHGATWTLAWGPSRTLCRSLNLIFTKDKVYWGSDSYESEYHKFFVAERLSSGVIDGANATQIALGQVNAQSCYGCVYLPSVGLIVMMDRNDGTTSTKLTWQAYDIASGQIVTICEFGRVDATNFGFRCKYFDWYPVDNSIIIGFALANSTNGTVEYNNFKVLGNGTGASNRVNNMRLFIDRIGNSFDVRVDTIYV